MKLEQLFQLVVSIFWLSSSAAVCPPGYADCPYFGCSPGQCPQQCLHISDEKQCSSTGVNSNNCKWFNNFCAQDIACAATSTGCTVGCMNCPDFGCLPQGITCPQRCDLYALEQQCDDAPTYGLITCGWSKGKCTMTNSDIGRNLTEPQLTPTHTSATPTSTASETSKTDATTSATKTGASATATPTSSASTLSNPSGEAYNVNQTDSGYIGMIVGIVLGVIGLIGILVVLVHRYRQKQQARRGLEDAGYVNTGSTPLLDRPNSFLNALRSIVDNDINLTKMKKPAMTSPQ